MWDLEVDVAVIGAGIGGLANAIATVDVGGEVLVADAGPAFRGDGASGTLLERVGARQYSLLPNTQDCETNEYLAAVSEGVRVADSARYAAVPRREARNLSQEEAFGSVAPFFGARLNAWAEQCISSPYGLLYTSLRDWRTTTMRSADGESIEVASVGAMEWADGFGEGTLRHWLAEQARQRDIDVQTASALERIVFEEGIIEGVVLSTPDGPYAVRTRAGITLAPVDQDPGLEHVDLAAGDRLQVCLVGRTASRFGRVELLTTEPAAASRPTCTGSRRQLRDGLHDAARQQPLDGWRCGKVYGYPALGQ
jgi:FAD binding domain-containing protein